MEQNSSSSSATTVVSKDLPPMYMDPYHALVKCGITASFPEYNVKDFYAHLIRDLLKNVRNALLGAVVGAIAERMAVACARTVVAEDKQLFAGELSKTYLSAAQKNEVLVVDGSVVRSGRNLTVAAIEFRNKKTSELVYTARATLYHLPVAKLRNFSSKWYPTASFSVPDDRLLSLS